MLVSSSKYLATLLTFFGLILFFLMRYHAPENSLRRHEEMRHHAFEASEQIVVGGRMTPLQDSVVYDKLSGNTPRDIEANWAATVGAKTLLQRVREFRISTQASYNDDAKRAVRKALEDAELELVALGKESFNTKRILQGVQRLKLALKAAEKAIIQGPFDQKAITPEAADGDKAVTRLEKALQGAEEDRKSKENAALIVKTLRTDLDAVIAESQSGAHAELH